MTAPIAYLRSVRAHLVLLYELVTQRVPFVGKPYEVLDQHVKAVPTPPSQISAAIGGDFEASILRASAKAPEARFPSAAEMRRELERL